MLDVVAALPDLCHDATPDQAATLHFVPQPNRSQTKPVTLGPAFAAQPRAYVFCTQDRTVTYPLQQAMEFASPCAKTFTLDCGHMPQLTRAEELSSILDLL